jgi:hypothetical protein
VIHQLELHACLSDVHNVFHISQFKKCLRVLEEQLSLERARYKGGFDIFRISGEHFGNIV